MSKVIHFEIPADDPERAVKFFTEVFDWKIKKWEKNDYWLIESGEEDELGINGAIKPKENGSAVRNAISVDSYQESVQKIENSGGKMLTNEMTIPGVGITGAFRDTEGNEFLIIELK